MSNVQDQMTPSAAEFFVVDSYHSRSLVTLNSVGQDAVTNGEVYSPESFIVSEDVNRKENVAATVSSRI